LKCRKSHGGSIKMNCCSFSDMSLLNFSFLPKFQLSISFGWNHLSDRYLFNQTNSLLIITMRLIAKKTTTSILNMPREVSIYFQVYKVTSQSRFRITFDTVGQLMLTLFDQFKYWKLYYCFVFNLFWSFYLQFEKFHTLGGPYLESGHYVWSDACKLNEPPIVIPFSELLWMPILKNVIFVFVVLFVLSLVKFIKFLQLLFESWSQCYVTFYGCDSQMFVIS